MATLKKQKKNTKDEFDERAKAVIVEFAQQVRLSAPWHTSKSRIHMHHFSLTRAKVKII